MNTQAKSDQPVKDVKSVPSTSTAPLQRLPSLRPPRDLTLSAYCQKILNPNATKIKKIYIPNLNVQRNKPSENVSTSAKSEPDKPTTSNTLQGMQSRPKKTLVQLNQGVFAQGISGLPELKNVGRGHSGRGKISTNSALVRPVLKLQENNKINKKEEEEILKNLLQDDFIDDPAFKPDFERAPTIFPGGNDFSRLKNNRKLNNDIKEEEKTVKDVFCNEDPSPGFILFQLPNLMPAIKPDPPEKECEYNSTEISTREDIEIQLDSQPSRELCPLASLPGGQIGKLQILKSGKARLVLGDIIMCVEMGTQVTFRQDVVSAKLDKATYSGDLINIGPIKTKMVVTPDWKEMITSEKAGQKQDVRVKVNTTKP